MEAMRRKSAVLLPLELAILETGLEIQGAGLARFHGFQLARAMQEREGARRLTAYGTLYKALGRLLRRGLLDDIWEDPLVAAERGRPRRRLYRVTPAGAHALATSQPELAGAVRISAKAVP
jgi:PadR family transcriptional regulator PadR